MKILKLHLAILFSQAMLSGVAMSQNYKIVQTNSFSGQKSSSTVYVRGSRKRTESSGFMGMGGDVATVEQCDLKRNIKISDKKRMYFIEPFDTDEDATPAARPTPTPRPAPTPRSTPAVTRGGTVTYVSSINDTGERKQMFGLTARHIKTSMTVESSPDACSKNDMKMETDGWYVDLPEFSCPVSFRPQVPQRPGRADGGCRDKVLYRTSGGGRLGFPLSVTQTMSMGGGFSSNQTTETLEFSRAPLDPALFDIPQGYALAASEQDLYSQPDISAIIAAQQGRKDGETVEKPGKSLPSDSRTTVSMTKPPGTIRIGVLPPTNRGDSVSTADLQSFLSRKITGSNLEAIAVSSAAEAATYNCDYILSSELSKLKQSTASKVGGLFGRVTGVDTSGSTKYEAEVSFKLVQAATGKQIVQDKASTKTDGPAEKAAEAVLTMEASKIAGAVRP